MKPLNQRVVATVFFTGTLSLLLFACGGNKDANKAQDIPAGTDTASYAFKEQQLNEQIKADPNNPALYNRRAEVHLNFGQFQKALNDASRAVNLDSNRADYIYTKGDVYMRAMRFDKALLQFEKAVHLDEKHWKSQLKLAKIFMYINNFDKAMIHINNALKVDDHIAEAYFLKGSVYELLGDSALAASSFQTAVEQKANYYDAYISLGLLYANAHDKLALEYYNSALSLRPQSVEALYNIAYFQQENGMLDDAFSTYRKMLALRNEIPMSYEIIYHNMGYIYLVYKNDFGMAVSEFDSALAINPSYLSAIHNRGLAYEEMHEYKKARADFRMALTIDPQFDKSAIELDRMDRLHLK